MNPLKTVLNIANKQANLGFGLVALLTAGGEQLFSSVVFKCPCNDWNFEYGMVFLLVPALALLLMGFILSKQTWKLVTGLCLRKTSLCRWNKVISCAYILIQIGATAFVAPSSWIAVALLNGNYFECAMTGTNVSLFNNHLCGVKTTQAECQTELYKFPCLKSDKVSPAVREEVMQNLRAESQILGWLLIASIMLFNLVFACVARCMSPISYLQLKFWRVYAQEENTLMDKYAADHAKELADRNVKSFFQMKPPKDFITPSNKDWEKISSLYKFCTKDHYYSILHQHVECCEETDDGMMRMTSVRSSDISPEAPPMLNFVDGVSSAV